MSSQTVTEVRPSNIDLLTYSGIKAEPGGDVGIEVEVECVIPMSEINNDVWMTKGDGSLRFHGYEFITKSPIKADKDKPSKLESLFKILKENKNVIIDSPRTSIHIHDNVQSLTPVETWTYITAYYLLENLLFRMCGENREGNTFCLRLKDAEYAINYMLADLRERQPFLSLRSDRIKYLGGNVNSIGRFGSFEWRGMRGHYDTDYIDLWSSIPSALREKSKKFISPALLMDSYWNKGADIIFDLLPDALAKYLIRYNNDWKELIDENVGLLCYLSYAHDWNKYQSSIQEVYAELKKTPKPVNKNMFWADVPQDLNFNQQQRPRAQLRPAPPVFNHVNIDDLDF